MSLEKMNPSYLSRQALCLRMFITYLLKNLSQVNTLLGAEFADPKKKRVVLFEMGDVIEGGILVTIYRYEDGKFHLTIQHRFQAKHFKLGNIKSLISKRLVNDIEVYFHREYRVAYDRAINYLISDIELADVKHKARNIPLVCRLFYKPMEYRLNSLFDVTSEFLRTDITIRRSIFNKLLVCVITQGPTPKGLMESVMPIHIGVSNKYLADGKSDPVNKWLRQVLLDHVELFYK